MKKKWARWIIGNGCMLLAIMSMIAYGAFVGTYHFHWYFIFILLPAFLMSVPAQLWWNDWIDKK